MRTKMILALGILVALTFIVGCIDNSDVKTEPPMPVKQVDISDAEFCRVMAFIPLDLRTQLTTVENHMRAGDLVEARYAAQRMETNASGFRVWLEKIIVVSDKCDKARLQMIAFLEEYELGSRYLVVGIEKLNDGEISESDVFFRKSNEHFEKTIEHGLIIYELMKQIDPTWGTV